MWTGRGRPSPRPPARWSPLRPPPINPGAVQRLWHGRTLHGDHRLDTPYPVLTASCALPVPCFPQVLPTLPVPPQLLLSSWQAAQAGRVRAPCLPACLVHPPSLRACRGPLASLCQNTASRCLETAVLLLLLALPWCGCTACRALAAPQCTPCHAATGRMGAAPPQDGSIHDHSAAQPSARLLRPQLPARASRWAARLHPPHRRLPACQQKQQRGERASAVRPALPRKPAAQRAPAGVPVQTGTSLSRLASAPSAAAAATTWWSAGTAWCTPPSRWPCPPTTRCRRGAAAPAPRPGWRC